MDTKANNHFLSLIIPVFRQENTIVSNLRQITKVMEKIRYDHEIIVVIDGMVDNSYKKIKKTKIPYIVAITKIDKPNANIERAKQSLGENEIYVEGWGGDVPCVEVSALNGKGISELLDMLILMAGLADLNANPNVSATGNVVESTLDTRKGISATLLLKNGSLQTSSCVVAGNAYTPVRFIENFKGEKIKTATVSMPIRVFGWNTMPACGIGFVTVKNKKEAEKLVEEYENDLRIKNQESRMTTEKTASNVVRDDAEKTKEEDEGPMVVIVPIIIKADVIGSLDG